MSYRCALVGVVLSVALLGLVSACSGGDSSTPVPTLQTVSPTTSSVASPTTEISADDVSATSTPAEAATSGQTTTAAPSTTTIEGWSGAVHPLTGLPAVDGTSSRPALVVKIGNNDSRSLPQVGLKYADVVYEAHIENGVTRFLGVFQSAVPLKVGPVRSARSSDIDLIGNLNRPVFAYWGSNQGVGDEVAEAERQGTFVPMTTTGAGQEYFYRDNSRGESPYNGFVDAAAIVARTDGSEPQAIFDFGPLPDSAVPTLGVGWRAPRRDIDWIWDNETARWLRFHEGVALLDQEGVQLAADNVLLLYVDYRRSDADLESPQAISTGSGDGWLLRDGTITGVTWSRLFTADPWKLADDETGESVALRPGRTWVALARLGEGVVLEPERTVTLLGR